MQIKVYENSLRAQSCKEILASSRLTVRFSEIIILPIPTTKDGTHINGTDIPLADALEAVGGHTLVIGYGIPEGVAFAARAQGAAVCDSSLDEDFLVANGDLTALAAIGIILGSEKRVPADMSIGIVGLGRIGRSLLYKLLFLGAHARVYTTRESVRLELAEAGVESEASTSAAALDGIDILINTAPASIFKDGSALPEQMRIIELASGDNFPGHPSVEKYPSVPARMYPESAGRIWAESVERYLLLGESFGGGN